MKTIISSFIFLLSILFFSNLFAQSNSAPPTDGTLNPFWDFYANNYLNGPSSGMGNTGIASDNSISGVGINPASLNIGKRKYQIDIQYTYKTIQPWLGSESLNLKQNFLSVNAAIGIRFSKYFQSGFIYSNPVSMYLSAQIIRTDEFGNEIGTYDDYTKYVIHSFTIPVVYSTNKLALGLNVNYSIFSNIGNFASGLITNQDEIATATFGKFNAQFGVQYRPSNNLSLGFTVTPEVRGQFQYKFSDGSTDAGEKAIYPWKLGAGINYKIPDSRLNFNLDYNYARTSTNEYLKDRNDINIGVEYYLDNKWTVRGGLFTLFDYRRNSVQWMETVGQYTQYFLTAGASLKLKNLIFDLSILDSHISPGVIKNTYINAGISTAF